MTVSKDLVDHCSNVEYGTLPDAVKRQCRHHVLDAIGIAIRATSEESSVVAREAADGVLADGNGTCTVWATGEQGPPGYATFLNGTHIHSLELDDTHKEGTVHPAAPVIPAAFATAERENLDGRSLIAGIVAGYEITCRLGIALPAHRMHLDRGFHATPVCGVFGAAVAGAVAAGWSPNRVRNAVGTALSQASGTLQWKVNGGWNKRIHPGLAAREATLTLELVRNGFKAATDPIEGDLGFLSMYGVDPNPASLTSDLGDTWEIERTGLKPYACCRYNHALIDATLNAVKEGDVQPSEITEIKARSFKSAAELAKPPDSKRRPENVVDAQFSPQYAIAIAATDQAALLSQFAPNRLNDPDLHSLMDRIAVIEDQRMTERHPEEWPARVVVETDRGTFSGGVSNPRGEPEAPLTEAEICEKFTTLTAPVIGDDAADLADVILTLDERDVTEVCNTIAAAVA